MKFDVKVKLLVTEVVNAVFYQNCYHSNIH